MSDPVSFRKSSQSRQRRYRHVLHLNEAEEALFQARMEDWRASTAAAQYGASESAALRYAVLQKSSVKLTRAPRRKYEHPSEILLARQLGQLLKIGTNVNQMARVMNGGGFVMPEILREAAEEIAAAARDIRRTLELFG